MHSKSGKCLRMSAEETMGIPESQILFPSENILELISPTFYTQI